MTYPASDPALDPKTVREQLYVIAHDETRGMKPRLHVPALAIGLTGATVIDLLIEHRIRITRGEVHPDLYRDGPTSSPIADTVLDLVRRAPRPVPLYTLLREFPDLYDRTRAALVYKGVLAETRKRFGRSQYELVSEHIAVRARTHIAYRIEDRLGPQPDLDSLCALVEALALYEIFFRGGRSEVAPMLRRVVDAFPANAAGAAEPDGSPHPLIAAPLVADTVRAAVQDLATAAF